ncbi:hypothetical protein Droror1_Dr00020558 [Drosera rotundifolia]
MKSPKLSLFLVFLVLATQIQVAKPQLYHDQANEDHDHDTSEAQSSTLTIEELFSKIDNYGYWHHKYKCDKLPRLCRLKGSPGPDCCHKKCTNVMKDRDNCLMCGHRCREGESCCKGSCINLNWDRHNCGRCGNKCPHGEYCVYGMCDYA